MARITNEIFLERVKKIHGDKYDYSKVNYIDAHTKVCIICHEKDMFGEEHGEFWVAPYNFLSGKKCPKCAHNLWTTERFIRAAKMVHGDKYDYSKVDFKGVNHKVCIISHDKDRKGNEIGEFWQYPLIHLQGCGCSRERRGVKEDCWEIRVCPICGKEFKVRKKVEKITCSEECYKKYIIIHREEINAKIVSKVKESHKKKTVEEKKAQAEKSKQTCLERYGVENYSKTEEARRFLSEKMKKQKSEWDRYNFENVLKPKYEKICEEDDLELLEFRGRFDCTVKCKKCGNVFVVRTLGYLTKGPNGNRCRVCHPIEPLLGPTKIEIEFEEFLKELGVKYIKNCRSIITPKELDYFLPDHNIAIELDGLYWHSEVQKPDPMYHKKKTEECLEKGIRLFHIFEDEWRDKKEICMSIISNALKKNDSHIGARKCKIYPIQKEECKKFLDENHIQGYVPYKIGYGLYYKDELVSVITFGKLRRNLGYKEKNDDVYEILRLCTKKGINIVGGASKFLKTFINDFHPKKIITYGDRRWSEGKVYQKIGFTFKHNTEPNYFYVINGQRKNRFAYRKSELIKKYGCPEDMTEKEFCLQNHWYRIYDCGSVLYELNLEK